jgi:hypothetical protein
MNAIAAGSIARSSKMRAKPATTPAATPSGWSCVVGTFTDAIIVRVAASTATTSVNVPPTSMPMRSFGALSRATLRR